MTSSPVQLTRTRSEAIRRRRPERRDDSGLTTLEWLLIVAAVAGMAALAVVLVTNVISDTSEQVEGQSARRTAAELAAEEITNDALGESLAGSGSTDQDRVNGEYGPKCERLRLIYGDVDDLTVSWTDGAEDQTNNTWNTDPDCEIT